MKHLLPLLLPLLVVGCASGNPDEDSAPGTPVGLCEGYPEGAVEPMALDEVIFPYRWNDARHRSDAREASLTLGDVPCNTDDDIDWSPFDVLLFVSIPAW